MQIDVPFQSTTRSTSSSAANGGIGVRKTMPSSARPSGGSTVSENDWLGLDFVGTVEIIVDLHSLQLL